MRTMRRTATREILKFARQQPGGVVRWSEALAIYNREADGAATGLFGKAVSKIFTRHFTQVEGVRGFYMLDSLMDGDNAEDPDQEVRT